MSFQSNADRSYKILWKEDFISYLRESTYYTTKKCSRLPVQRYSDKVINVIENDPKTKREGDFLWQLMPAELRPSFKRIRNTTGPSKEKRMRGAEDIDAKLKALEQKESSGDRSDVVKKEKSDSEDEKEGDDQEEEMADEEMDDDNDYGNNYFDNGEAYNDEDDNLDDGPVY